MPGAVIREGNLRYENHSRNFVTSSAVSGAVRQAQISAAVAGVGEGALRYENNSSVTGVDHV